MLRRLTPAVLSLALIVGCAADYVPGSGALSARERILGEHIFSVGYSRIADYYLAPVDLRQLTLDGLQGLVERDPAIGMETSGGVLRLTVRGHRVGEIALPDRNTPGPWAEVTSRAIERLRAHSSALAALGREETYQLVFESIVRDLDEYSRYTSAERATYERSQREGYGGVGLALQQEDGRHMIAEVTPGGPAAEAGIRSGELVLAIDGDLTDGLSADKVGELLRGHAGSVVMLTVGSTLAESRRLPVRRDWIVPNTVEASRDGHIGIVRIDRFNAATERNLRDALLRMARDPEGAPSGYVLDLRGNPGGKLDQAIAVADLFMRTGRILDTRGRHPDSMQHFEAAPDDVLNGAPMVVLVDGRSASAAEIVAAALQDSARAVIVGASSFGKGSVQTVTQLPNDGELFLTWSRFYAPSGYTLHRQGVQPTVCTSKDARSADEVLLSMVAGAMPPAAALALWRTRAPEDEEALTRLRESCPWKEHAPEIDLDVAKALLETPSLYRRALGMTQTNIAERQASAPSPEGVAGAFVP